jgi:geranylgeranylglycerol-phosphate geranylgeranyltransferase
MRYYIQLIRPLNCTMAAFAVVIGARIASKMFLIEEVFIASLVAFLVAGAGFVINDYFDFEIDKINRPSRPLPSGRVPLRTAYIYALSLFSIGVLLAVFINIYALFLAVINSLLLYAYAWRIKKGGGIEKNLTVSYLVASPFLFGGIAVGKPYVTLILVLLAGLANTGREIIKDIEDYEGDRGFVETLPMQVGFVRSAQLAAFFISLALIISPLPYISGIFGAGYLLTVALADALFLFTVANFLVGVSIKNAAKAQRRIKMAMLLALLAFLLGSL